MLRFNHLFYLLPNLFVVTSMSFEDLDLLEQLPRELQKLFQALPCSYDRISTKIRVSVSGRIPRVVSSAYK